MNPVLRCSVFRWLLYSDRDCINDLVKIRARPLHPVSRECFEAGSRSVRDWCLHCPGSRDWLWSLENIFETSPSLEGRARWSPRNHDSFGSRLYPWKSLEVNLLRLCGKYVRNFVIVFWNVRNAKTVGAGKPNTFWIPMATLCSVFQWHAVFQWCSVLNKVAAILSKTIRNRNKMAAILFGFTWKLPSEDQQAICNM